MQNGHSLPPAFLDQMASLLGDDFDAFVKTYDNPKLMGLRVNSFKITPEAFERIAPFKVARIPWTLDGFYVLEEVRPAKHPFYHAGLYYLQEPSAMSPVAVLSPQSGDYVLDVCAAPGGKTLQIANAVGDRGLVVSNDISATRLKAVVRNVEQFGLKNVIITASDIEDFSKQQQNFYDKVLLDAPCSGEGMFRKDPSLVAHWEIEQPESFQMLQKRLLEAVDVVLKDGGEVVYSTCTFSTLENEAVIQHGLEVNPEWNLLEVPKAYPDGRDFSGFAQGVALGGDSRLKYTRRLYPHYLQGEGHYVAHIKKGSLQAPKDSRDKTLGGDFSQVPLALKAFMAEVLNPPQDQEDFRHWATYRLHQDKILVEPRVIPDLKGVRVLRRGWYLGDLKNGRFEPAPSFAMGLQKHQITNHITFNLEDPALTKYLKCETLSVDYPDGWYVVCLDDYPLGWAKVQRGQLKNKYPAAWRMV